MWSSKPGMPLTRHWYRVRNEFSNMPSSIKDYRLEIGYGWNRANMSRPSLVTAGLLDLKEGRCYPPLLMNFIRHISLDLQSPDPDVTCQYHLRGHDSGQCQCAKLTGTVCMRTVTQLCLAKSQWPRSTWMVIKPAQSLRKVSGSCRSNRFEPSACDL
jgi:hypothetical protein